MKSAYNLKETVRSYLGKQGHTVKDYGVDNTEPSLYPNIALEVSNAVADGQHVMRYFLTGTGIGMAITAKELPGIRAAVCHDVYSAWSGLARTSHRQVLALGVVLSEKIFMVLGGHLVGFRF